MRKKLQIYELILEKLDSLRLSSEKNIFSLGGRGHYENPISDIFAFYLDKNEEHGLQDLFIKSYFDCYLSATSSAISRPLVKQFVGKPIREAMTTNKKRIDILIEGVDWVLLIENKIRHVKNNPFQEYKDSLKNNYPDKKLYLTILSPTNTNNPEGWVTITYESFIAKIEDNIGEYTLNNPLNKWMVLLREFVLNIKEELKITNMDEECSNFIEENIGRIRELASIEGKHAKYLLSKTNIPDNLIREKNVITIGVIFRTYKNGVLIGYENSPKSRSSKPDSYVPIMFVGTDGKLRSQLWTDIDNPITTSSNVNDGNWHSAILVANKEIQYLYFDGIKVGELKGKIDNLDMSKNQWGTGFCDGWEYTNNYWFRFKGDISCIHIWSTAFDEKMVSNLVKENKFCNNHKTLFEYNNDLYRAN